MTQQNKLKMPEEILGKLLDKMTEDDALTLALAFELDRISPEQFRSLSKEAQHDYAQRILDFFRITAKSMVIGLFKPEKEKAADALQHKITKLKVKSPRAWPRVPKDRIEEFRLLELAFELWLDRKPQPVETPTEAVAEAEKPVPKELLRKLFRPGTIRDRDIYTITGNSTGKLTDDNIAEINRFCQIRAITWQEFLELPVTVQKLYLKRLASFFRTTWSDLAKWWFKGTVSSTTLESVAKGFDIQISIVCNRDVVKVIKQCAKRKAFTGTVAEEEARESEAQEIPPVADSEATLLPNGEIVLEDDLKTEAPKIDTFYTLQAKLSRDAFYEIEAILRKYEGMGAIRILQSSRSHLDAMSFEA